MSRDAEQVRPSRAGVQPVGGSLAAAVLIPETLLRGQPQRLRTLQAERLPSFAVRKARGGLLPCETRLPERDAGVSPETLCLGMGLGQDEAPPSDRVQRNYGLEVRASAVYDGARPPGAASHKLSCTRLPSPGRKHTPGTWRGPGPSVCPPRWTFSLPR